MSTTTATETSTASWVLDGDAYVKQGAFNDHSEAWGEGFRAAGGTRCYIEPGWLYGMAPGEMMLMTVVGTPEALAYVEATVAA